jgi:hypothetical protein
MNRGRTIFAQVMDFLPWHKFRQCVRRYRGNYKVQSFSCSDQYRCMAFAQLTGRESLRDIQACFRAMQSKLYHMGIRGRVSKSTLADANENRDWRIYADFAQVLIHMARPLYTNEDLGVDLDHTVYALDSTIIDLCLSLFPWARFRRRKAAIKLHTVLDLRGPIPTYIRVTDALLHDVHLLDWIVPEPGAFYIFDRAYVDYARLYRIHRTRAFFVTRARRSFKFRRQSSRPVDKTTGLRSDQIVRPHSFYPRKAYPDRLRRIRYVDLDTGERFVFLTNHLDAPALTIAELYRCRWQIELFFKWIKQHLRIKAFYGTSANAVKTQVWIAISVYTLVAIVKQELGLKLSLYTILQVLSLTPFEKVPLQQALTDIAPQNESARLCKQLPLFDL